MAIVAFTNPSSAANLGAFFDQPYIVLIPVEKQVGRHAKSLQLAGLAGLKPPDAVHLASATVWNVSTFHIFDKPLIDLTRLLAMADGNPLEIMMPTHEIPIPGRLKAMQERGLQEENGSRSWEAQAGGEA